MPEENHSSSSRSHQLPIASQLGLGPQAPLHHPRQRVDWLDHVQVLLGQPQLKFMSTVASAMSRRSFCSGLPQFQSFRFLSHDAHWTFGERACAIDVPFRADYSRVTYSPLFDQLCISVHHHPLRKEASMMRCESRTDLWVQGRAEGSLLRHHWVR